MWVNDHPKELRIAVGAPGAAPGVMALPLTSGEGTISQQYKISEYVGLCFSLGLVFIVAFQLPVVMLLGGWTGLLDPRFLKKWRKHVLFGCAIASALATPADPLSMVLLMIPLYALFELGLVLMRITMPRMTTDGNEGG